MSPAPIYIVSKGRAESRLTNKALASMGIRHFIVVEQSELEEYARHVELADILVLPEWYKDEYDVFDDFGLSKSTGPGPARNFVWDHAIDSGSAWHWVMDDNINGFFRLNHNLKTPVYTRAIFDAMESFVDRYENLDMAGPNYFMFAARKSKVPAFVMNTRIYSCNLIRTASPFRWRGRYNEDTDLSLVMLKAGRCTVQFNAFLQYKMPTQTMSGGNTDEFYAAEGTSPKSEMLSRLHPDVARTVFKFSREHHHVDYSIWKDRPLRRRPGSEPEEAGSVNNFGMVLKQKVGGSWLEIDRPLSEKRLHKYSRGANPV